MPPICYDDYKEFTAPRLFLQKTGRKLQNPRLVFIPTKKYIYFVDDTCSEAYDNVLVGKRIAGLNLLRKIMCHTGNVQNAGRYPALENMFNFEQFKCGAVSNLSYTYMIRVPDETTLKSFHEAIEYFDVLRHLSKNHDADIKGIQFAEFTEGFCVETLFVGLTDKVDTVYKKMMTYIENKKLAEDSGRVLSNGLIRSLHLVHLQTDPYANPETGDMVMRIPIRREAAT